MAVSLVHLLILLVPVAILVAIVILVQRRR